MLLSEEPIIKTIISITSNRLAFQLLLIVLNHLLRVPRFEHVLSDQDYLALLGLHLPHSPLAVLVSAQLQHSAD